MATTTPAPVTEPERAALQHRLAFLSVVRDLLKDAQKILSEQGHRQDGGWFPDAA